jgi:hypothetical protein
MLEERDIGFDLRYIPNFVSNFDWLSFTPSDHLLRSFNILEIKVFA